MHLYERQQRYRAGDGEVVRQGRAAAGITYLPAEGVNLSESRRLFRVEHYAKQWDGIEAIIGKEGSDDERCRKGCEKRPVVCVTNMRIFQSVTDAAR